MSSRQFDSTAWVSVFRRHMDEMMQVIYHLKAQGGNLHEFSPLMDVYETADDFVVELDLPGFNDSDFAVAVSDMTLRIDGVKRHEKPQAQSYICLERHYGRFSRTLEIPEGFDPAGIQCSFERGVLSISVPKV